MPCGCWRGRRGACPPSSSPPRSGSRRTRRPSCRGACAAPWRDRSASDVLSGEVEADDFFVAARDRTRRRGAGRGTGTRPMLAAAGRTSGRRGRCALRVVPDCGGPTWGSLAPSTSTGPRTSAPTGGGAPRRASGPSPGSTSASSTRTGATRASPPCTT